MIIDRKQPFPEDPTPAEAPPSYDDARRNYPQEKRGLYDQPVASSSTTPPSAPVRSPGLPTSPSASSSRDKGKGRSTTWFNFAAARTTREMRTTVLGLVRDLVQENLSSSPAATGILQSCSEACAAHDVPLSDLLQEKSIEGHTPLYWAIVKRLPDDHADVEETQGPSLLSALLSYASPLNPETRREIRLACLATSDQKLFQRLRMSPEFSPISGVERMLLGVTMSLDDIDVQDVSHDGGAFAANFVIPHFHKRMVVSKKIELEFIARGRLWRLAFEVAGEHRFYSDPPTGSWCIALSLLESSPPTYIDSQVVIPAADFPLPNSSASANPPVRQPLESTLRTRVEAALSSPTPQQPPHSPKSSKSELNPTISLRLTSQEQLQASGGREAAKVIVVQLESSLMGAKLQYANNPYLGPNETLRMRFEAKLGKPRSLDAECVVC